MDLHIVLHEPEIPQNTGSIGRTCVALGARLHLIDPIGFSLDDKYLKRAGMDYWKHLDIERHRDWESFCTAYPEAALWFFTTKARVKYSEVEYGNSAFLVFGKETAGLPQHIMEPHLKRCVRIPIISNARSLNLSVAVGIGAFEVMRQNDFPNLASQDPLKRL